MSEANVAHGHGASCSAPVILRQNTSEEVGSSSQDAPKKALFISYVFPPSGGGGVQRSAKFVKYLPSFGWQPTVLTASNPSVPVCDTDLAKDIAPNTPILRAKSWEPSFKFKKQLSANSQAGSSRLRGLARLLCMQVLQPDPQILWNRSAYRSAVDTLQAEPHDVIYVTAPPFSSFLLGCKLCKRFQIPLILDFRDEWTLAAKYLENYRLSGFASSLQYKMMLRTLRAAAAVIATTNASADELTKRATEARSRAIVRRIYNGYDPDDFKGHCQTAVERSKFSIVYTGTLWKLTDIRPFVTALEVLAAHDERLSAHIDLVIAGRRTPEQEAVLEPLNRTRVSVRRFDYLPHQDSLALASSADLLLLLLSGEPGAQRVVPAKLFEYMALQKPILAVSPPGETEELLSQHALSDHFVPQDTEKLAQWLSARVKQWINKNNPDHAAPTTTDFTSYHSSHPELYSRKNQTEQLAAVFNRCIQHKRS